LQVFSLHFSLAVIEIGVFADDLMQFFRSKNQEPTLAPNKQKDFFNFFPILLPISVKGYPYPLCTPNSTQVHPIHPRIGRGLQP